MDFMRITVDPHSLVEMARMLGFGVFLSEEMRIVLREISDMMVTKAEEETWAVFSSPSGQLASTIVADVKGPFEATITVESPYGERREKGFSGMTDALGRTYMSDPAKPFLAPALEAGNVEALVLLEAAVNHALDRIVM